MTAIDEVRKLEPYKSLVLARIGSGATLSSLIDDCLHAIKRDEILDISDEDEVSGEPEERVRREKNHEADINSSDFNLEHGFLHYELHKPVPWTNADDVRDTENHLVLFSRKKNARLLALYASENSRRRAIRKKFGNPEYDGLRHLYPIEPDELNDAFFGDQVRTLWLSGMHRRVPVKADAKVLSGQDLEYALDPVNDQTFYFSAVRSSSVPETGGNEDEREDNGEEGTDDEDRDQRARHRELRTVGLSPKKSRIWTRPSSSWGRYLEGTNAILSQLGETLDSDDKGDGDEPLPVLADVASGDDDIGSPCDMVIQPPELLSFDVGQEKEEIEELEEWAYNTKFQVVNDGDLNDDFDLIEDTTPPNVVSEVYYREEKIGKIAIDLNASDRTDVQTQTVETKLTGDAEREDYLETLESLCGSIRNIKVYYDTAHTLSDGSIRSVQFENRPFEQFLWAPFNGEHDITKEKPSTFPSEDDPAHWGDSSGSEDENEARDSLFDWVYENWPPDSDSWDTSDPPCSWKKGDSPQGWLATDDGSMEIADFIHYYEPEGDEDPVLSLIHVKAADEGSETRQISVANYEVVTGQAVKNLRHLESTDLAEELEKDSEAEVRKFVWEDGDPVEVDDPENDERRDEMAEVLKDQDSNLQRRVVVLQPRIRRSFYERTREGKESSANEMRLQQLDTLLNGARQSCNGLGAEFWVVAAEDNS
jgi:hypothetical protein